MPSPTYEQNKKHIYKWQRNNADRVKEIDRRRKRWHYVKIEFLNILI
jgi:hypothetical protein